MIEFKFVEHLKKILNTLDYCLEKCELISRSKLRKLPRRYEENFTKIWEKLQNTEKKIGERLKKFFANFSLSLRKVCRKSVESRNVRIIKSTQSRNHRDQYLKKSFKKNLTKFYKTFEEL